MGLLSRRPSTPVGPFAELSKHSRFAYIEKLEFWPEARRRRASLDVTRELPRRPLWVYSRRVRRARHPPSHARPHLLRPRHRILTLG